jgi:uncharacterized protein involved in outer membrane biogenesis
MKKLIKWVLAILLVLALLAGVLLLVRDPIIKTEAEKQIRAQTGMDATIGLLHVGIKDPVIQIENLRIYNLPGFLNPRFLDIPEIHVEYDRGALLSRKLRLTLVRFNLADVSVDENFDGKTNIQLLQERQKKLQAAAAGGKASKPALKFAGIDKLILTLGRVRFTSAKDPRRNSEQNLNIKNYELKNIESEKDFKDQFAQMMKKNDLGALGLFLGLWISQGTDL